MFQAARWGREWDMIIRLAAYLVVFSLQGLSVESLKLHIFEILNKPDFALSIECNVGHMSKSSKTKY